VLRSGDHPAAVKAELRGLVTDTAKLLFHRAPARGSRHAAAPARRQDRPVSRSPDSESGQRGNKLSGEVTFAPFLGAKSWKRSEARKTV
jgi:hypothetical protein